MIELDRVSRRFGGVTAVDELSLRIASGEFCVLVGPSGCGKSTTLRMINRLVACSSGQIRIDGQDIATLDERLLRLRIGYAIQNTGLFPHWTVARNIALVPQLLGWPRSRIEARVGELLALLELPAAEFADKYPDQLSGGQAQRVGVARALAGDPEILLMDEPFGALDPITRDNLQNELLRIQSQIRKTIVFVTHDIDEALKLAERIVVMEHGRIVQHGSPQQLLDRPANALVEQLLGQSERGLKRAGLRRVETLMRPPSGEPPAQAIAATASLRQALSHMLSQHCERLAVRDAAGRWVGVVHLLDAVREEAD
ncbi:ABC transporter ATP-binding protein [Pseudomonas sp. KHPS1]|uniref:ABC transporter ATP-binding protein n=1 Tax=Ectopseudomonas oleovorans TaxID=301 RepID=A0AB35KZC8_ECTOL|nr:MULTISPECIES: ABC transporter ATP-binding protein [Pseudomonas]ATH83105.1 ABC transporter [Pseudomonas mendocina]MCR1827073.1 ABC transporter ATP-binding protein [Pseudomonas oleovorans]MDH0567049.1 ABC transporter ATP-binding protein [Pseudomonas oleovorans]UTH37899.1 ABC transporter ATP-binding protein [Pseudomonas sp. KHPS1]